MNVDLDLGARVVPGGVRFRVWAPKARRLAVTIAGEAMPLDRGEDGVFEGMVSGAAAGTDYRYLVDGERERPDPVSRFQPDGVHGVSRVVDPSTFTWTDRAWRGIPLEKYVIYELHVGTFTPEGTFASAIGKLPHLVSLGVTAVEIMPVAEFPGGRNWGYDGVYWFAPQSTYGGPEGLRRLVDACHAAGLAVVMDVVYNHLGPEGNYLPEYAPYFTDRVRTAWGPAINVDGPDSDGVRRHVLTNAVSWFEEYHVDALRLDAIHGIFDFSARHILEELEAAVREATPERHAYVIAESDLNDARVIRPSAEGGYGIDSQWSDDLHHSLRTVLTKDRRGYFSDFGSVAQLGKAITGGFVYDGIRSEHRRRRHGNSAVDRPGSQFVVFLQNHDQIANGSQGRRFTEIAGPRAHALAASILLTSPNVPLLFMGEEFAERAPFLYFVSHSDEALVSAVREGRRLELAELADGAKPADPQSEETFLACKLDWAALERPPHSGLLALYRDLLALRRDLPCLANCRKDLTRVWSSDVEPWIVIERGDPSGQRAVLLGNLGDVENVIPWSADPGTWRLALDTDDARYGGSSAAPAREERRDPASIRLAPKTARLYVCSGETP